MGYFLLVLILFFVVPAPVIATAATSTACRGDMRLYGKLGYCTVTSRNVAACGVRIGRTAWIFGQRRRC